MEDIGQVKQALMGAIGGLESAPLTETGEQLNALDSTELIESIEAFENRVLPPDATGIEGPQTRLVHIGGEVKDVIGASMGIFREQLSGLDHPAALRAQMLTESMLSKVAELHQVSLEARGETAAALDLLAEAIRSLMNAQDSTIRAHELIAEIDPLRQEAINEIREVHDSL